MNQTNATGEPAVKRTYKSRMFEMIFSSKRELLELYNAMHGTHYDDPELLEINTLENAIYMSMHNDISFLINLRLSLYEHQSTYSPNLPLRYLMYLADLYSAYTKDENLYGSRAVKLPTPNFVIFYNGEKELPDTMELKLSDLFTVPEDKPALELTAVLVNINRGHNQELMTACKTLRDYAEYTARVREYAKHMPLEDAVEKAITECIRENILSDFLTKNRAEAKSVSIYEYNEEKHMRQTREEGLNEGLNEGIIRGCIETFQELQVPQDTVIHRLMEKFNLTPSEADGYMAKYWK
ncbi:MAG: hypothetical protein Q4C91_00795 [Eubacteriales bacterium]|nr:hypothetical protein [Eubacteriales bacterium]